MIGKTFSLLALAVLLSGCAMKSDLPEDPQQRLEAVKALTQDAENRAVRLLPEGDVEGVRQLDTGTFLRCGGGEYQWSGNVRVQLKPNVVGDDARELLARSAASEGFDVSTDKTSTGKTRNQLLDAEGVQLLVTAQEGGTVIDIDSGSPCFALPDSFGVPREY
ncbi:MULTISPECIES: hypothetical protein [Curtobacterium]|uniref:hypothetical protein n=1 Tax=Curtobacterium TaxID=2034 RepID=UPI00128F8280|nr:MULTISPECIES: hypothetical protein [Curtobacterium]UBQ03633.1 hypothetical protein LCG91_05585 [Curtobacterium sp. TXMA1]